MSALVTVHQAGVAGLAARAALTIAFPIVLIGYAAVLTIGQRLVEPAKAARRARRTAAALAELDDRLLADIGLDRPTVALLQRGESVAVLPIPANRNTQATPARAA